MKKIVLLFAFVFAALTAVAQCTGNCSTCTTQSCKTGTQTTPAKKSVDYVEVLYLHGKQRCKTCIAIEKELNNLLNKELADLVKQGIVKVNIVDTSTDAGAALAKKYKASWSALFVVAHGNGKARVHNLTDFAFSNAYSDPTAFRKEVVEKVTNALK